MKQQTILKTIVKTIPSMIILFSLSPIKKFFYLFVTSKFEKLNKKVKHTQMSEGNPRIYIGGLSSRTRPEDIERAFGKYGRIHHIDTKLGFSFVEYEDARDASDAVRGLNGSDLDGRHIVVELATGRQRRAPGDGRCFSQ